MFDLALCYRFGIQVKKNRKTALNYFRKCNDAQKDLLFYASKAQGYLNQLQELNFKSFPIYVEDILDMALTYYTPDV